MPKTNKKVETLRVLGVDPGTAIVGWAILDEVAGQVSSIAYGHITTSPGSMPKTLRGFEIFNLQFSIFI